MPLFRRYGRPGLLGGLHDSAVVGGTREMIGRSVSDVPASAGDGRADARVRPGASLATPPGAPPPIADQLRSLIDIHSHGDLSDEEFVLAKARLLE